jgi:UTP--glucose-1-phosphate uridylyltransferase
VAESSPVSAVQPTREHLIHQYGTLTGRRRHQQPDVYQIEEIVEKPTPTEAEQRLQVPGLRAGHYLCFFGMHVLTPSVFDVLDELVAENAREAGQIQLTTALNRLARAGSYLALETRGERHNLGVKYGVVDAQLALTLAGVDRDLMLGRLLELLIRGEQQRPSAGV